VLRDVAIGPHGRRALRYAGAIVASVTVVLSGAAVTGSAGALPKPPPNPTNGQINAARNEKQQLAAQVGELSGQIAQAKIQQQQAQGRAELAEQKYALAMSQLQQANQAAARAKAAVRAAQGEVVSAHARFVEYIQATYMSGGLDGTAGTLLTANDPSAVLEQTDLEQFQQQHQIDAIGALQTATVDKSNADAKARLAVQASKQAAANANVQRIAARNAYLAAQAQSAELQRTMNTKQAQLDAAQLHLATLNNERAQFQHWLYERWLERQREIARERRLREEQQQQQQNGGGGGSTSSPPPPSSGSWTAAKGIRAANRARSQVGWPYAWAGGGAYGPSRGVCDPSNGAPNDCNVIGYDCSGLAMFAWGASWWAHYAATQYTQAGAYHPGAGNLLPGDLIFWSSDGTIAGIHHVAIYIGGGQIVEAPYSGGFVQVASLYEYGGFFGATRPFT
jgi:cell wall-associated NlpC family hydrolase